MKMKKQFKDLIKILTHIGIGAGCLISLSGLASTPDSSHILNTKSGPVKVEHLSQLNYPWGMAFLPDGQLLITEKPGNLRLLEKGKLSGPLKGVPKVAYEGQGGLLDVEIDPDFSKNQWVYLSYAEAGDGGLKGGALARGKLIKRQSEYQLQDVEVIWRQVPKTTGAGHYGGRIVFASDGTLFLTSGERQKFDPAQDLKENLGKIIHLNPDGTIPKDNPFINRPGTRPDIWSLGHRNPLGIAIHPTTQKLWIHEMGPRHGDELNLIEPGKNYGWPLVSNGDHYDGRPIPDHPTRPEFTPPVHYWAPAVSPSGLTFYYGNLFKTWKGNILMGGLSAQTFLRLEMSDNGAQMVAEERIQIQKRIRDVIVAPDGAVLLLTDGEEGELLRLTPAP